MLLCKIDSEMNVQNCGFSAKWRRWRHAPRLTEMAVVTDPRCRFSKRWHVADVKDIGSDDQATLMVDWNSTIYVCLRLQDNADVTAADGVFLRSLKRHVADIKNITGDDQNRLKFCNYDSLCIRDQEKPLEKHLFAARTPPFWWHCVLIFFYYDSQWLLFSPTKIISWRPWPPPKIRDLHI